MGKATKCGLTCLACWFVFCIAASITIDLGMDFETTMCLACCFSLGNGLTNSILLPFMKTEKETKP